MAIARFLYRMRLALQASGLWLRYVALQNVIPSFPWIGPPRPPPWRNTRKGRDQILPSGNLVQREAASCPGFQNDDLIGRGCSNVSTFGGQVVPLQCLSGRMVNRLFVSIGLVTYWQKYLTFTTG